MIKASVILGAALCIAWLLRKRSAAERHVLWTAAIISAATLPLCTSVLPSWQPALAKRVVSALPSISPTPGNPQSPGGNEITFRVAGVETTRLRRLWPILWTVGSIATLLLFGAGVIKQKRLARGSLELHDPGIASIVAKVACGLRCGRPIHLRRSLDEVMPMTWGIFRPQVLLPNSFDHWSDERKRLVISHEAGHVKRWDCCFQIIAQIACAVYWFNPLFWIARNRLYGESEQACDDIVINLGVDGREYASHLLAIARALRGSDSLWSATFAMARQSTLERRFAALLSSALDRRAATRKTVLSVAAATLILVLPLAAMRISADRAAAGENFPSPQVNQYTSPPLYSDEARARGIEGIVTVEARIGIDGLVKHLQVVKGLGYGLDENAMLAVRDWRFIPAKRYGIPMEAATEIDVEFSLRNAELNELIANEMATRIGPGVTPPQIVRRFDPQYPTAGKQAAPEGAVILDAVILEDGTPKIIRVIQSLDWELNEIAVNALKQWKFSPAMKDGRPIKVRMDIALHFQSNRG